MEDQPDLIGGNSHPPEYYQRGIDKFDYKYYDIQDYSEESWDTDGDIAQGQGVNTVTAGAALQRWLVANLGPN